MILIGLSNKEIQPIGSELIGKIPYPLDSSSPLYSNGVATMDYARTVFGLPVPKVFGWSASADRTDVGAEYMLMEKIGRVQVHQRYNDFRSEGFELINDKLGT